MTNRWLLTLLLAPILSPAALAVEAYSLYGYVLDDGALPATCERDQGDAIVKGGCHGR
jgi:hypothetical protein